MKGRYVFLTVATLVTSSASPTLAQPCADAPVNYIFQTENPVLSDEPFAAMIGDGDIDDLSPEANRLEVPVATGELGQVQLWAGIVSQLGEGAEGVQGWSFAFMVAGDVELVGGGIQETVSDPAQGLFQGGFEKTEVPHAFADGNPVITGATVLSFTEPITLPPVGTATIVGFELETPEPMPVARSSRFEGELLWRAGGYAQPVNNVATIAGASAFPCREQDVGIAFVHADSIRFRRGDANDDERVDISDAIFTFMFLFMGGDAPRCGDAADSNDDGGIDLSDGLNTLNDFFRPGTAIPHPGPFGCGVDLTSDGLGCRRSAACE